MSDQVEFEEDSVKGFGFLLLFGFRVMLCLSERIWNPSFLLVPAETHPANSASDSSRSWSR